VWNDLKRYREISPGLRHLLWEALVTLAIVRVIMACVPFRRIASWFGTPGAQSPGTTTSQATRTAESVGWAVETLGRRVPWDGRCLAQALAATNMLRRRGIEGTVAIGVCDGKSSEFEAHAWLRVGSSIVTGADGHERFKAFTTFSRARS
jgi:hypothetical protein